MTTAIIADTEKELNEYLEELKDKYSRIIEIYPKRRGTSAWIALVEEERK